MIAQAAVRLTRVAAAFAALLLAGCAAAPRASAPQACDVHKAAEIPVDLGRGFLAAPALIERNPVVLLIDTGAESSQVTPAAMRRFNLHEDPRRTTEIHGLGGVVVSRNALLQSFGIGGMDQLGESLPVAQLPPGRDQLQDASGLLGADWLSDFDVELDLPHGRVALYRVHGCDQDYIPWEGPRTQVSAQLQGAGLVLLQAQVDGHPVVAMLDSGTNVSQMTEAAAARVGADEAALARDPASRSSGVDLARIASRGHRFGALQIGPLRYPDPVIYVSRLHLQSADMLLGADWLRKNRVWISYARRRVSIQPATAAPAPS